MARKSKKRARQKVRPQVPVATAAAPRPVDRPQQRVGGDSALVRAVEMSLAPQAPVRKGRGQSMLLDGGNPAIPLDRVPYFWPDLQRLGVAVVIMVALLIGGSFLIPLVIR
jgi:hypothetical protein